jgi:hypothetical protein
MYKIGLKDDVITLVARFDPATLKYWNVSLNLIATDPLPRHGSYAEQIFPFPGVTWRTYNYWITQLQTDKGETIYSFTAEYFDYRPVYIIDLEGQEVEIFAAPPKWVYDPLDAV